jgi:membrane fusion protein, copper/silver efflux system
MKRQHVLFVITALVALVLGWYFGQRSMIEPKSSSTKLGVSEVNGVIQDGTGKIVKYWYDPMVPQQKFDKPGKSPFMDMELVPKYANESNENGDSSVTISSQTVQNLGIRLVEVETKSFGDSFATVGRVEPNDRLFYDVQTRIPGFVERLFVRAVGDPVRKGQKIAEIYAPELLAAQEEYLTIIELGNVDSDNALKNASRNRLRLLGMTDAEIRAITAAKQSNTRFGVYAPASGVVTELGVREGGQLMAGSSLIQITDLSQVWLIAEVPERDAARLKIGVSANITLQSLPDVSFKGKVSYLYPILDNASRTLQVRIELLNVDNQLRPGMYANVEFSEQKHEGLSVPSESVIATGKRKVVIVKNEAGYRPAEIVTGQVSGNYTEVLSGLEAGEQVVASGQFLIDSEASLSGVLARLGLQEEVDSMHDMHMEKAKGETIQKMPKGRGKVVDIDVKSSHITLNHEPIDELGWPSMTMGFKVKDNKQIINFKTGDEVEFDLKAEFPVDPDMPAQYMIDRIEKSPVMGNKMTGGKS